ncbi:hypothetical protein ACFXKH_37960, partial [Streptomyces caelestis]|uniref:hypothetical protein n=1 Tax=Streptomyces caelestis TaxID=36816 RepID=UPI0036869B09
VAPSCSGGGAASAPASGCRRAGKKRLNSWSRKASDQSSITRWCNKNGQHPVVVRQAQQCRPQWSVSRIERFRREGGERLAEVCVGYTLADDRTTGRPGGRKSP